MYGDFEFDSFEVTSEGNVVIINMENLSIIDREAMAECKFTRPFSGADLGGGEGAAPPLSSGYQFF